MHSHIFLLPCDELFRGRSLDTRRIASSGTVSRVVRVGRSPLPERKICRLVEERVVILRRGQIQANKISTTWQSKASAFAVTIDDSCPGSRYQSGRNRSNLEECPQASSIRGRERHLDVIRKLKQVTRPRQSVEGVNNA